MPAPNDRRPRQGGYRNARGPKKDTRKYLKGKEGKTDEIRKALTHRARLRKNYFKLLEREGLDVPDKEPRGDVEDASGSNEQENAEKEDSENEHDDELEKKEEMSKPKTQIELIKEKVKNHEALTFQERILIKKDRREKDKQFKMQKTKEKLNTMKEKDYKRQRQTERLQNTKTRKGQPLMGPRINLLLEKIKQDKSN